MSQAYSTLCDDFAVSCCLMSKVEMPGNRETVLNFFESVKRAVPEMNDFDRRDNGEFVLEEDRDAGSHRWVSLDSRRLCLGYVNPPDQTHADEHAERILHMAAGHLDLTSLQTEALDVIYQFDFLYAGNHDELVAEALAAGGPLDGLARLPGGRVLNYQPVILLALDDACQLQARLSVETRTTPFHVRHGNYPELPISVYCTVRQIWGRQACKTFVESYHHQRRTLDDLVSDYVLPSVVQPICRTISTKQ